MSIENISDLDPWNGVNDVPVWTLGDRLRKALRHADIPVHAMAVDLGVSTATIGRWMNDRGPVKRQTLKMWALTTGVSFEWLETGQGQAWAPWDSNPQPAVYVHSPLTCADLALAA